MTSQALPDPSVHGKDPAACPGDGGSYPLVCHLLDTAMVAEILWSTRVRPALRARIADITGVSQADMCRILALVAAVHDLGKANPFFQYQERAGAASAFAATLQSTLGLPGTTSMLRDVLNSDWTHPLRRHEFISHRIVTGGWAEGDDTIRGDLWLGMIAGGHHGYWRDPDRAGWVGTPGGVGDLLVDGWTDQQQALLGLVEEAIGLRCTDVPTLTGPAAAVPFACLSGLLTLADWIASDNVRVGVGKTMWSEVAGTERDPYGSAEASRGWMKSRREELTAHVEDCLGPIAETSREGLTTAIMGDYSPRPLQAEAISLSRDDDPGLWICMYPTGDGKTESALLRGAVAPEEGFIFGLPTLATTDAMEARLTALAERLPTSERLRIIKSHQFADMMKPGHEPPAVDRSDDECCDQANPAWYSTAIRKLVAPNVVGTVDQVLTGALAHRHITLRLLGIANHHVILDEVHTYDEYQTELLVELLYWWGSTRTRVTLLSATLPRTHMQRMIQSYTSGVRSAPFDSVADEVQGLAAPFPSTVSVSATDATVLIRTPDGAVRRPQPTIVDVPMTARNREDRITAHVDWARDTAATHPASPIGVFTNVVADCTKTAARLAADPQVSASHEVICLHSSLVAGHRKSTEERLIERAGRPAHEQGFGPGRKPVLVVGTQVIQASLDFDVDFAATDLAPAADLIQRLGRAWRFEGSLDLPFRGGRLPAGAPRRLRVVPVVDETGTPTWAGGHPYLSAVLRRTLAALRDEIARNPLVDIFEFSQTWVDAAYDRDPRALLSEHEAEVKAATQEVVDESKKRVSAAVSKADLARSDSGVPLLPGPSGRQNKGPRWSDLVTLTTLPDDENLMRTRYIEHEAQSVILFDSRGTSHYRDPQTGRSVMFERTDADRISRLETPAAVPLLSRWRCTVPSALRSEAEQAIERTLPGREWVPTAKILATARPLDLAALDGIATYDPITGLMKQESR